MPPSLIFYSAVVTGASATPTLEQVLVAGNNTGNNMIGFFNTSGPYLKRGANSRLDVLSSSADTGANGTVYATQFTCFGGGDKVSINSAGVNVSNDRLLAFSSGTTHAGAKDAGVSRSAAGVIRINNGTTSAGGTLELLELASAPAGSTNAARLYAVDNGAGKTQLFVIFASGAAQLLATEP